MSNKVQNDKEAKDKGALLSCSLDMVFPDQMLDLSMMKLNKLQFSDFYLTKSYVTSHDIHYKTYFFKNI